MGGNEFLLGVIDLILVPDFFVDEGEMHAVTGFSRQDYEWLRARVTERAGAFKLFAEDRSMMLAAINNISGYPHGQDDLVRERMKLGEHAGWYGSLFERLLPHMPDDRD